MRQICNSPLQTYRLSRRKAAPKSPLANDISQLGLALTGLHGGHGDAFWFVRQRPGERQRSRCGYRPGLPRLHRFQRRGRSARLSQHLLGRAPFHRLVAGLGNAEPPDLPRGTHQDPAPRHGCHGSALAQSGAARRAGRDPRRTLRRPARFRDWQGLSPQRIHRLLHPKRGGRRAVRGGLRGYPQGVDLRRALLPSWQVLEFRQYRRRACRRAAAAASDLDGCG